MRYMNRIIPFLLLVYSSIRTVLSSPDIAKLENDQKILLDTLRHNNDLSKDLHQKFKFLDKKDNTKSLNAVTSTIPVENDGNFVKVSTNYSPPVIVLLPEDSTSREKWEYAVTLKCLGQNSFDAFTNIHNTRMAKMASISGSTVSEINAEIRETEQELANVKKELESAKEKKKNFKVKGEKDFAGMTRKLHLDHNIKLLNQEIHVMEVKLERLKKRLKSAVLFGNQSSAKEYRSEEGSEEYGDEDDASPGGAYEDEEAD